MTIDCRYDPMRPDTDGESPYGLTLAEFNAEYDIPAGWHYIYGLYDPRTGELRYIGKSDKPRDRLTQHMGDDRKNHRCAWIRSLKRAGLKPVLTIIDATPPGTGWETVERVYIAAARADGHRLTNGSDGGEGAPGLSPESRQRMREAHLGRKQSPETRAKRSAALQGRSFHTELWRQRVREANTGRPQSRQQRDSVRDRMQKLTPDQVREIRRRIAAGSDSKRALGREFSVSDSTIHNIASGRVYGHIRDDEE